MPTNFDIYHHLSPSLEGFLERHYQHLNHKLERIMTAVQDFATKQQAYNDDISKRLDDISTEITNLNTLITTLQNSSGTISAADQATLDQLVTSGAALQSKADALDTLSPPVPPTT